MRKLDLALVLTLGLLGVAHAQQNMPKFPKRPGPEDFVVDGAKLLDAAATQKVKGICGKLLKEKATPILVVTIPSMASCGAKGWRIESFAQVLFDQWGIGHKKIRGQSWNHGILLLISKGDRKARIQLGAGWGHREDKLCQEIMDTRIVPFFKKGEFGKGVVAGVEALDKMARKLKLPPPPKGSGAAGRGRGGRGIPTWVLFVGGALLLFTIISLARRGTGGWAWLLWAAVFGVVGYLLYSMMSSRGRSGGGMFSGGSFSGGSFGGGFSGGGGATGSW